MDHFEYKTASEAREKLRTVLLAAFTALAVALLAFGAWRLARGAGAPKKRPVQQISLVQPPLPPKQEKPPEPEKPKEEVKQEVKMEQPKDDAPPPAEDLGLDAKGTAGNDGFGLVGRPGGRDITTIGAVGNGNGGRGNAFYANQLQIEVQEALSGNEKLRGAEYRAQVNLWLSPEGGITRIEIAGTTGDSALDKLLRAALSEAKRLKAPPEGLAQPVRLELVSRRT